jgi:hypothetical protein
MPKFIAVLLVLVAAGVAYVVGTKAGRGRYREISAVAKSVWDDPAVKKVREKTYRKVEKAAARVARKL